MSPLLQHLCPKSSVSGGPLHSQQLPQMCMPLNSRQKKKKHIHRTVMFISENRNSTGKWEMWMSRPELMNRYDGISFLRCLTHTTTYCVTVLKQESLSSRSQRPEGLCGRAAGGEGGLGRRLVSALCHMSFLCVRVQTPLFSLVRTEDRPPQPSSTTSS